MSNKIFTTPFDGKICEIDILKKRGDELIVWWYGGILKNFKDQTQPKVVVFFRKLGANGSIGEFVSEKLVLTNLEHLRIGSVWKNGISVRETIRETVEFDVNFNEQELQFVSPSDASDNGYHSPVDYDKYPLYYRKDKNWLIKFQSSDGRSLLIPCLEFYMRYYGRSSEVKRVLVTFNWDDVQRRCYAQDDYKATSGQWYIKLGPYMYNSDAVFLAHMRYDTYAMKAAKKINSDLVSSFERSNKAKFITVKPWFEGLAKILVKGLYLDKNKKVFLGLQILGGSEPSGLPILIDRDYTNFSSLERECEGVDSGDSANRICQFSKPQKPFDITGNNEPDRGAASVEITNPNFIILGESRCVSSIERDSTNRVVGVKKLDSNHKIYSSGDAHGTEKGIDRASLHTPTVKNDELEGVLFDIWNALCYLKKSQSMLISLVKYLTLKDKFQESDDKPELISLLSITNSNTALNNKIKKWDYLDVKAKTFRGALVLQVMSGETPVYFFEIQRRKIKKIEEDGTTKETEEHFKGLVFTLNQQEDFPDILPILLHEVRKNKGILDHSKEFITNFPGEVATYSHNKAKGESVVYESTLLRAFRKVGIPGKREK